MPEWLKGADCNSAAISLRRFESFSLHHQYLVVLMGWLGKMEFWAGVAQLVEHQPSKLNVASSNLVARSMEAIIRVAHVAQ